MTPTISAGLSFSRINRRISIIGLFAAVFFSTPLLSDSREPLRAAVLAGVLALAIGASTLRKPGRFGTIGAALVATLAVLYIASVFHGAPASSVWGVHGRFQGVVSSALYVLAGVAGYFALNVEGRWLGRAAAACVAVEGLVVISQSTSGQALAGTMGNSALTGGWLAMTIALAVAAGRTERGIGRWLLPAAGALGAVALGMTGSRGGWVGLLAGLLVSLVLVRRNRTVWTLSAVVVAALVIGVLASGGALHKLATSTSADGSASSRIEIWKSTGALVARNPLVGVGPGRLLFTFPQFETVRHAQIEGPDVRVDEAHSVFLQAAAESGVPAAVVMLALVALCLTAGWRGARLGDATSFIVLVGLVAYVAQGVFGIPTVEVETIAWLLGGMALARYDSQVTVDLTLKVPAKRNTKTVVNPVEVAQGVGAIAARAGLVMLGLGIVVACIVYMRGDAAYSRGLALFDGGKFTDAAAAQRSAIAIDPYSDVARIALSDTALNQPADVAGIDAALNSLAQGLTMEPLDFDLLFARARLAQARNASAADVLRAYQAAVQAYPLGIQVRREAMQAALLAGDSGSAFTYAEGILLVVPDDRKALSVQANSPH